LGSNIVVQHSVGPIITLHGRITAREYEDRLGNQVHPMMQTLFQNNDAPIHTTAGSLHSWFEEHELQHLPWPAQSLDLNITKPLWSVSDTIEGQIPAYNIVLQEEWYKISLGTVQNLYESIP
jgi:hypothetical protein